jgi:hypothetical protein
VSITRRGARSYLVRVEPFPAPTLRTKEDAERVELELKRRKALGEHYEAPPITLGDAMDGTLARLRATGNPSASGMALNELAAKAWEPLRGYRVSALRRDRVEEGEKRANANRLQALVQEELDENDTDGGEEALEGLNHAASESGRYWARTSDPQLVELVLSQLS